MEEEDPLLALAWVARALNGSLGRPESVLSRDWPAGIVTYGPKTLGCASTAGPGLSLGGVGPGRASRYEPGLRGLLVG